MKKRIQLAALAGTVLMALSFSACAVDMSDTSAVSSTSSESSEAEATPEPVISVDESKYEDSLDGLADYMKKKEYISGDATETLAAVIGAEKGVKYTGSYEGNNNITMELYEYNTASLNDTAKEVLEAVKKDGKFDIMGTMVDAVISDSGKYLMIYKDSATGDLHDARTEAVMKDFKAFKK